MSDIRNPYIAGSPVTGSEMFFGREDVFTFVRQNLMGKHRDNILVLYGQRRTGKTSILYQMHSQLDSRYLCIFIDLHGLALEGLSGFLWELTNFIVRTLHREYNIELLVPDRIQFTKDPRNAFEEIFLIHLWSTIGDRHILLMLDEAIRLQEQVQAGKMEQSIFEYLRHLMQHYEQLNFLFSLGSGLEEMEKEYAFLFNVALYKKISFLDRNAAIALITQPIQDFYEVEPTTQEKILQVTSGHPYFTQLVCHCLFNRWQQKQESSIELDMHGINEVLDEAVERGLAVLKHVWEESMPGEKILMAGMSFLLSNPHQTVEARLIEDMWATLYGISIPKGEMANTFKSLIAREIIFSKNIGELTTYGFTVDLQRLWTQKYRRPEWAKEEIADFIRDWFLKRPQRVSRRRVTNNLLLMVAGSGLTSITLIILQQWLHVFSPAPLASLDLEPTYYTANLNVDPNGLVQDSIDEANVVKQQVLAQPFLVGRRVGYIDIFAGAVDSSQIPEAQAIDEKVVNILKTINSNGFNNAAYSGSSFYSLFSPNNTVVLHIYLYKQ